MYKAPSFLYRLSYRLYSLFYHLFCRLSDLSCRLCSLSCPLFYPPHSSGPCRSLCPCEIVMSRMSQLSPGPL